MEQARELATAGRKAVEIVNGEMSSTKYISRATLVDMKNFVHARLTRDDRALLDAVTKATGQSESDVIRIGLRLAARELAQLPSAADLAGESVGCFAGGPADLSTNRAYLDGFGQ